MEEVIGTLVKYLETLRVESAYVLNEDREDSEGNWQAEDSPAAELARKWARQLLDAADANGLHGCRLCQS